MLATVLPKYGPRILLHRCMSSGDYIRIIIKPRLDLSLDGKVQTLPVQTFLQMGKSRHFPSRPSSRREGLDTSRLDLPLDGKVQTLPVQTFLQMGRSRHFPSRALKHHTPRSDHSARPLCQCVANHTNIQTHLVVWLVSGRGIMFRLSIREVCALKLQVSDTEYQKKNVSKVTHVLHTSA